MLMDIRDGLLDKVVLVIHIFEDLEFLVFGGLDCIRVGRKSKVILAGSNTLLKMTVFMFHSLVGNICDPFHGFTLKYAQPLNTTGTYLNSQYNFKTIEKNGTMLLLNMKKSVFIYFKIYGASLYFVSYCLTYQGLYVLNKLKSTNSSPADCLLDDYRFKIEFYCYYSQSFVVDMERSQKRCLKK